MLFAIYEEALVTALDPGNEEWLDPSLECITLGRSALVMTAYNPGTARPSFAENEAANQRMFADIRALGYDIWQADGFSADGTWREPGWLVWDMPLEAGISIASAYGQFAVYAYDIEGVRSVVACDAGGPEAS